MFCRRGRTGQSAEHRARKDDISHPPSPFNVGLRLRRARSMSRRLASCNASRASPNYPAMAYLTIRSASTAGSNPNGGFVDTVCKSLTRHERSIFPSRPLRCTRLAATLAGGEVASRTVATSEALSSVVIRQRPRVGSCAVIPSPRLAWTTVTSDQATSRIRRSSKKSLPMIRIAITAAAYHAICSTLARGRASVASWRPMPHPTSRRP